MTRIGCHRWDARTDENQKGIVRDLRAVGISVQSLGRVGEGCPDLLLGYKGRDFLCEIKTSKGKLKANQEEWIEKWGGEKVIVARTSDEIIHQVTGMYKLLG